MKSEDINRTIDAEVSRLNSEALERRIAPGPAGTMLMFRQRGHVVTVRELRNCGGFRYTLDTERERTALELSNRYAKLYERGVDSPFKSF